MTNRSDPDLGRPGSLRGAGRWLSSALLLLGVAALIGAFWPDGPGVPAGEEDRPPAPLALDDLHAPVWSLAFSADGARLASCTVTGEVWLIDEAMGVRSVPRRGPDYPVRSLAFSPDGRVLAMGGPGSIVRFVDVSSASEREALEVEGGDNAAHVALSPDGRYLAAGGFGGSITIWDRVRRRRIGVLAGRDSVTGLGFAPDGSTLAAGDVAGRVRLWAIPDGTERRTLAVNSVPCGVTELAYSPAGTILATASKAEGCVRLWDPSDGRLRATTPKSSAAVRSLAFSPDGALLAIARADGGAVLWGIAEGRELARVQADGSGLQSVAFPADGRSFATGGVDGRARQWDLAGVLGRR